MQSEFDKVGMELFTEMQQNSPTNDQPKLLKISYRFQVNGTKKIFKNVSIKKKPIFIDKDAIRLMKI